MDGAVFREHLAQLGIFRHELAAFAGISLRTVNRWCSTGAPKHAALLAAAATGQIQAGCLLGWQSGRELSGPTGESYTLADIRAAHWLRQLTAEQAREADRLRQQLDAARREIEALRARPPRALPCARPEPRWRPDHETRVDSDRRPTADRVR